MTCWSKSKEPGFDVYLKFYCWMVWVKSTSLKIDNLLIQVKRTSGSICILKIYCWFADPSQKYTWLDMYLKNLLLICRLESWMVLVKSTSLKNTADSLIQIKITPCLIWTLKINWWFTDPRQKSPWFDMHFKNPLLICWSKSKEPLVKCVPYKSTADMLIGVLNDVNRITILKNTAVWLIQVKWTLGWISTLKI